MENSNNLKSLDLSGCGLLLRYPKEEIDLLDLSKIESLKVNFDQSALPLLARTTRLRYLELACCDDLSENTTIENMPPNLFRILNILIVAIRGLVMLLSILSCKMRLN